MTSVTVRDAAPSDVDAVADLVGVPSRAAERLLRERAVLLAERDGDATGALAYDADADAVHVTRLVGDAEAVAALLEEPIAFARAETIPVEVVVPASASGALDAVANAGFEDVGDGPRFAGERTARYRLAVEE
ncbi:hypothetical protein [Halarchaeum grantii]|uniref:hypothetical protein n=1 Tax=Halarchaeum grantii TaxID=1193105 RepID=UPI00166C0219|nr:hypothetical protein [Halarchaeum grantii]